ncbi:MAG: hypothetical protein EOL97_00015 [Spirochaetia bacterium]|nr:hypothetical protein [Spirochaetia bacterium]
MEEFNKKLNKLSYDTLKYIILNYSEQDKSFKEFVETHFISDDVKIDELYSYFDDFDVENEIIITDTLTSYFDDIKLLVTDFYIAIDLIMKFFQHKEELIQMLPCSDDFCDDSKDYLNDYCNYEIFDWDHYSYRAYNMFIEYAILSENVSFVINKILELFKLDESSAVSIIKNANKFFNGEVLRLLYNEIEKNIDENSWYYYTSLLSLSRNIPDGTLFKKMAILSHSFNISVYDIADVYIKEGKYTQALEILINTNSESDYNNNKKNQQLLIIYTKLNDIDNQRRIAKRIFSSNPTIYTLNYLSNYISQDIREQLITNQVNEILNDKSILNFIERIDFLASVDKEEAEKYSIMNYDVIKTLSDKQIVKIIEILLTANIYLPIVFLYRKEILLILEKAKSNKYSEAANYLKILDNLSPKIVDWKSYIIHEAFLEKVEYKYINRKKFWSEYGSR